MAGHEITTERVEGPVRVTLAGTVLADSDRAVALHETGYPVRHYLPRADVRMELLTRSETRTHCPFKGEAEYFSATGAPDLAWSYAGADSSRADITDLIAFDDDKVAVSPRR